MDHEPERSGQDVRARPGRRLLSGWPGSAEARAPSAAWLLLCALLAGSPGPSAARTWLVPQDALTIQAGIDSAQAGDDVLISRGTFYEHDIVMKGGIRVHGEVGSRATRIDAQWMGRVFLCSDLSGEAVLEGITMANGRAESGGAIRCLRSDLRIEECVIDECEVTDEGGGVSAGESDVSMADCVITDNHAFEGGGVSAAGGRLTVRNCIFKRNRGEIGGGIAGSATTLEVTDSAFAHNHSWTGGGIRWDGPGCTIERCLLSRNVGSCQGGAICASGPFEILDCVIEQNFAVECGIGWALLLFGSGRIAGCTVAGNWGWGDTEVIWMEYGSVSLERTIVAYNEGGTAFMCMNPGVTIRCCDVYGNANNDLCGEDLGGNFSADPLFCAMDSTGYDLDANSPCLPGQHPQGVACGLIGARGAGCGTPMGACCFPDGSCARRVPADCAGEHGIYMGDGTDCDPNPCVATPVEMGSWGRIKAQYSYR